MIWARRARRPLDPCGATSEGALPMIRCCYVVLLLAFLKEPIRAQTVVPLANTKPLEVDGDLSVQMLDGIHRYLERKTDESIKARQGRWRRDLGSVAAYEQSVRPNRERFRKILGVVDERVPVVMERFGS